MFKAMIQSLSEMGANLVKSDDFYLYFEVIINSQIDDECKLQRAAHAIKDQFGLGMKIKKIISPIK